DFAAAQAYEPLVEHLMFESKPPKDADRPGGLGVAFDWTLLAGRRFERPWFLAGGLDPGNVAGAIAAVRRAKSTALKPPARPNDYTAYPDAKGRFGDYGGQYVPETLMPLVHE